MKKVSHSNLGFTMIEALVSIAISSIAFLFILQTVQLTFQMRRSAELASDVDAKYQYMKLLFGIKAQCDKNLADGNNVNSIQLPQNPGLTTEVELNKLEDFSGRLIYSRNGQSQNQDVVQITRAYLTEFEQANGTGDLFAVKLQFEASKGEPGKVIGGNKVNMQKRYIPLLITRDNATNKVTRCETGEGDNLNPPNNGTNQPGVLTATQVNWVIQNLQTIRDAGCQGFASVSQCLAVSYYNAMNSLRFTYNPPLSEYPDNFLTANDARRIFVESGFQFGNEADELAILNYVIYGNTGAGGPGLQNQSGRMQGNLQDPLSCNPIVGLFQTHHSQMVSLAMCH